MPEIDPPPPTAGEEAVVKVKERMQNESEDWQTALAALVNAGELCAEEG